MALLFTGGGMAIGVDRERNILRGFVVAQAGDFKTPGRGRFDQQSLQAIVRLMQAAPGGLRSRFTHPGFFNDALGTFLGRARSPRIDGNKVRADLYFDPTALDPNSLKGGKPLGVYVMDLAESDPGALSSSLVLNTDRVFELDPRGRKKTDASGAELPPIWRPTKLHSTDIVDTGDAVDDLLAIPPRGSAEVEMRRRKLRLLEITCRD